MRADKMSEKPVLLLLLLLLLLRLPLLLLLLSLVRLPLMWLHFDTFSRSTRKWSQHGIIKDRRFTHRL